MNLVRKNNREDGIEISSQVARRERERESFSLSLVALSVGRRVQRKCEHERAV